jgi:glycosyltransferase involved in cell wall biosynthesis
MNICIISREFPPDTAFGGIATFSLDTALILKSRGHDVTIFSQSLTKSYVNEWKGIHIHKIKVPWPFGSYRVLPAFILAFNFVVMREVIRCHRRKPFDIIDVPDHLAEGLFTTLLPHIPVVTRLHTPYALFVHLGLNNYRKGFSYFFIKTAEKLALQRSEALYAPTEDLVRRCEGLFSLKDLPVKIFGYPLDLNLFSPVSNNEHLGTPRILFLSRLEQRKGIETIATAFPRLRSQFPDVKLTLVGHDTPNIRGFASARQYLESVFTEAGCVNAVHFVNYVPLEKLPEIFHAHDIVWVPSMYDNYPLICLEAMACGKAVVVSDAGGLPEMVQHNETGLVFEKGNADALVEQTLRLCNSDELRQHLGKNARVYCMTHCSENALYEKNIDLYEFAIARSRGTKR